jgi:hypothetical protein
MKLNDIEPVPVVCSQSKLACAIACPRKWWYRYRMGIEIRGGERRDSAHLGTIYHRMQCLGPGSEASVRAEVQRQQTELMDRVNKGEDLDGELARTAGLLTEMYNKAVVMSQIFWERFPQPEYMRTMGTEVKIRVNLEDWDFPFEGTIDKIVGVKGDVWIRDHKSTGRSLETIFAGLPWSLQARIYRILLAEHRGESAKGFILDGIVTPGIKLCRTDEKNAKEWNVPVTEAYLRRVKEWYKDKPDEHIRSRGIIYTEELVPNELYWMISKFSSLGLRCPHEPSEFERDVTRRECFAYERRCPYYDLCETDPKQWDALFETKYRFGERTNETEITEDPVLDSDIG